MCLIAFDWRPDAAAAAPLLTLAGNRDEFLDRPATPLDWWPDVPGVLGGRDLQAGGSWLAVSRDGRFAALTNYRDPLNQIAGAPTRGRLVGDFMAGTPRTPLDYLRRVAAVGASYNGFNLLVGDFNRRELAWYSNRSGQEAALLGPGVYGLSNALLDTPWPKVLAAKSGLAAALRVALPEHAAAGAASLRAPASRDMPAANSATDSTVAERATRAAAPAMRPLMSRLLDLLRDPTPAADELLPHTGIAPERERALSAAFIELPEYGTRSTTALTVLADGRLAIAERSDDDGSHRIERPGASLREFSFGLG